MYVIFCCLMLPWMMQDCFLCSCHNKGVAIGNGLILPWHGCTFHSNGGARGGTNTCNCTNTHIHMYAHSDWPLHTYTIKTWPSHAKCCTMPNSSQGLAKYHLWPRTQTKKKVPSTHAGYHLHARGTIIINKWLKRVSCRHMASTTTTVLRRQWCQCGCTSSYSLTNDRCFDQEWHCNLDSTASHFPAQVDRKQLDRSALILIK